MVEHWASIPKVVGSNPTVARHIFQACPVWIYTQSSNTYNNDNGGDGDNGSDDDDQEYEMEIKEEESGSQYETETEVETNETDESIDLSRFVLLCN